MHCASFQEKAWLESGPGCRLDDFGASDFTAMALLELEEPGVVMSLAGVIQFDLAIREEGRLVLRLASGSRRIEAISDATLILDGTRHFVAAIWQEGQPAILLDGREVGVTVTEETNQGPDFNGTAVFRIGRDESGRGYRGTIRNVSLWRRALTAREQFPAAFGRITGRDPALAAFWSLDGDATDRSKAGEGGDLLTSGEPQGMNYTATADYVWTTGPNDYAFFQLNGLSGVSQTTVFNFAVPAGVPFFGMAIMAAMDIPAFPAGVKVTLTDPSGVVYKTDTNTETIFVQTVYGQLWGFMAAQPAAGNWTIQVISPGTAFQLTAQTYPNVPGSFPYASESALQSLYPEEETLAAVVQPYGKSYLSSWISAAAAVSACAMVIVAVSVPATVLAPAVLGMIVVVGLLEIAEAQTAVYQISASSLSTSISQVAGASTISSTSGSILYWDANLSGDYFTQKSYAEREIQLYSNVVMSPWNLNRTNLLGLNVTAANVASELAASNNVYVTSSGHGFANGIDGWFDNSGTGAYETVLFGPNIASMTSSVTGKIFHFWSCYCGVLDCATLTGSANPFNATGPGLGVLLVNAGATAFFGYSGVVYLPESPPFSMQVPEQFIACDVQIDLILLQGGTCADAYTAAMNTYQATYNNFIASGDTTAASYLKINMDGLVAPSTNAAYGSTTASIAVGP